jgi:FkbM family methyltransferase
MSERFDSYVGATLPIERELRACFSRNASLSIFDIGACEGEDSVRYARLFPRATIYAVEPVPSNVERIRSTVTRYRAGNVRILPFALAESRGRAHMYLSAGQPPGRETSDQWDFGNKSSSLLPPGRHLDVHPWVTFDDVMEVETRTLADVCQELGVRRVDFIHMDVQGAELRVLEGLGQLILQVTGIWLEVEAVPLYVGQPLKDEVEQYLVARGFSLVKDTVDGISGDQLWMRAPVGSWLNRTLLSVSRKLSWLAGPRLWRRA